MNPAGPAVASGSSSQGYGFKRGDHVELAEAAHATLGSSPMTYDEGSFWRYNESTGLWERLRDELVNTTVASFAGAPMLGGGALKVSRGAVDGARKILQDRHLSEPNRPQFRDAAAGVAFANGFVNVVNGVISVVPHDPSHMAPHGHPFDFAPGLPHPQLDAFFDGVFSDTSPQDRADRVALIQEFVGASLIGEAPKYQTCLVLYGDGANGKSQLLEVAASVAPGAGVVAVPPQKWSERFQIAGLVGATLNLCNEIPDRDITNGETFKAVIDGTPVHAERKYQEGFDFRARAGHIFCANTLPSTTDQTHGFWRRFLVVLFTVDMQTAPNHTPDIGKAIVAAERPAIVAWALEGAARLQRQGKYTIPASSTEAKNNWRNEVDPVRRFIDSVLKQDPSATTSAKAMFGSYANWADENNFAKMSSSKFFRRLTGNGIKSTHTNKGSVYPGWRAPDAYKYDGL
jgi:P4 family phage/plasmid primase-like protien